MKRKDLVKCVIGYSLILGVFLGSISLIQPQFDIEETNFVKAGVGQVDVQSYAVKDFYSSDWSYLKTYYGTTIDEEKHSLYDDVFASIEEPGVSK